MDQIHNIYNMVHACEIANQSEKDIAIRRASGFNELFEAAVKKEHALQTDLGLRFTQDQDLQSGATGKGKEKQWFGPEIENLKELVSRLVKTGSGTASSKWTWAVYLTEDDFHGLTQGANQQNPHSHTEYNDPLSSDSLQSITSAALNLDNLEDHTDSQILFEKPSLSVTSIPELPLNEFPKYSDVLVPPGEELVDPKPW